jgi:hypothetical protein
LPVGPERKQKQSIKTVSTDTWREPRITRLALAVEGALRERAVLVFEKVSAFELHLFPERVFNHWAIAGHGRVASGKRLT